MRALLSFALVVSACGSSHPPDDAGGGTDAVATPDGGPAADGGGSDGGGGCDTDDDCTARAEWCEGGVCVPCDNGGVVCDIDCRVIGPGWDTYVRNGCTPCACAPPNECEADTDCAFGAVMERCVPGRFCWGWCPAGDPSCCRGNVCAAISCTDEPPTGCLTRGCEPGRECVADPSVGCAPSQCNCSGTSWSCTRDCGGGVCFTPA